MIAGLLRRNHVAESHRGSNLLETRVQNKRARQAYTVLNHLGANQYQKFYCETENIWVSCGDSVQFGDFEDQGDRRFGQLTAILIDASGNACMRIALFERSHHPTPTALDNITPRFKLVSGPASSIFVEAVRNDVWVGPYCTQPDFDDVLCVYHCPWMAILK